MPVALIQADGALRPGRYRETGFNDAVTSDDPTPVETIPDSGNRVRVVIDEVTRRARGITATCLEFDPAELSQAALRRVAESNLDPLDRICQVVSETDAARSQARAVDSAWPVVYPTKSGGDGQPVPGAAGASAAQAVSNVVGIPADVYRGAAPPQPAPAARPVMTTHRVLFDLPFGLMSAQYHDVSVSPSFVVLTFRTDDQSVSQFMPGELKVDRNDPDSQDVPVEVTIPHLKLQVRCLVKAGLRWAVPAMSLEQLMLLRCD